MRSSNSAEVRVFSLDYSMVMERVRDYARKLVDRGLAELVVLVGSLAKGNYTPFSDIDLVIVVKKSTKNLSTEFQPTSTPASRWMSSHSSSPWKSSFKWSERGHCSRRK
ncbi:MAG: nucleotidyltransferase domain-containing protein [Candidatus Caldarchaeum sp.]